MMAMERINVHPLVNTMTTGVHRDDLLKFLRATGHEPLVCELASAERDLAETQPASGLA
jgi:Ala-tRNA(Pro) deacylase